MLVDRFVLQILSSWAMATKVAAGFSLLLSIVEAAKGCANGCWPLSSPVLALLLGSGGADAFGASRFSRCGIQKTNMTSEKPKP